MTTRFPEPPRVEELDGVSAKLRQNLQRWMSDLKRWGTGGGLGTVTSITATLPAVVTPSPLTTVGVVSVNTMTGDSGAGGSAGAVPAPAAGDTAAGKFLKASGAWAVPPSGGASPLTTKGDVWGFSTVDARIPIGADGNVLTADATQVLGLKWAPGGSGAPVDATYVVMSLNGTLTNERRLQVTGAATLTDGGANGDATINVPGAGSAGSQFNWGKFIAGRGAWPNG